MPETTEVQDPAIRTEFNALVSSLRFRPGAIRAVRGSIREGFFRAIPEEKMARLRSLATAIIAAYNEGRGADTLPLIPTVSVLMAERSQDMGPLSGGYLYPGTIILNRPSLVTFLHELGHHIQSHRDGSTTERFARGFAIGLYRRAAPGLFRAAAAAGRIGWVDPRTGEPFGSQERQATAGRGPGPTVPATVAGE